MATLKKIIETIQKLESFAILCHVNPDGDAIGSVLALHLALEKIGKSSVAFCSQKLTPNYNFLPHYDIFKKKLDNDYNFDCIIALDCGDEKRVDKLYKEIKKENCIVINIDHHISNDKFGDINFIDTKASSTAEIIYSIINKLKINIDKTIAELLYFGIIIDTGNFKFSNTTYKTFKIASNLTKFKIDINYLYRKTYEEKSFAWLKLLNLTLNRLNSSSNNQIIWSWISFEDFQSLQVDDAATREIIDIIRSIKEVKIAMLFKEYKKNEIKVSFRSNGDVDVNLVASVFGGGGHRSAAACSITGDINYVSKIVIDEAVKHL